jgi:endoglucanase
MYMKKIESNCLRMILSLVMCLGIGNFSSYAQLPEKSYIRVDQFGYLPNEKKFAVISKAESGFNAGAGIVLNVNQAVELRKKSDNTVVFSANATVWNSGIIDARNGDKGWWVDFTSYATEGEYYIRVFKTDGTSVDSYPFKISNNVYKDVLKTAVNMFYYQRCNIDKTSTYASGANWTDTKWYTKDATAINVKNTSETRDLTGGWIDAGDPNKYSNFAVTVIHDLLSTYEQYPSFWNTFDLGIPESANNTPDLLDEVKWELDWLKKMQLGTTGSYGSLIMKMGIKDDDAFIDPPSRDARNRYYSVTCPHSTIIGSGMFAHAALVYRNFSGWATYATDLTERAEAAWTAYQNAPNKGEICANDGIKAGDGNGPGNQYALEHIEEATCAAVYLFALTGKAIYHDFFKANYARMRPWVTDGKEWATYRSNQGEAVMFYTTLPNADATVKTAIINRKISDTKANNEFVIPTANSLYRHRMNYNNFGTNNLSSAQGSDIMDYVKYNLRPNDHAKYKERAISILNYMHGVNPLGLCFLTNMYQYGGDLCGDELWHTWFHVNSKYDNITNGNVGPAPGFLLGGVNKNASGQMNVKVGQYEFNVKANDQPEEKEFSNKNFTDNPYMFTTPWEYCEPGIYYQSSYIKLLTNFVATTASIVPAASVDVTPNSGTIEAGLNMQFNAVVSPLEASQNVVWLSSNPAVATVNSNGLVTSLSAGTTYIKAVTLTGNKSDSSLLTVIPAAELVTCGLIENVGFESNFLKWDNSANIASITTSAKTGIKAAVIDVTGGLNYATTINVPTNGTLTLKAWAKVEGSPSSALIGIDYINASGVEISEDFVNITGANYTEFMVINNKVLPTGTTKVQVWTYKNGGKLYLDDFCLTSSTVTSINPILNLNGKIYPNPVDKEMMVPVKAGAATIEIVDMKGRIITTTQLTIGVGQKFVPISTLQLKSGNYVVNVKQGSKQSIHKITKLN